ncbi:MAG: transglycosylase domain-containing protein [Candidatus Taylorbacteria bacterium]|nr:transglycosylase domain-containing protein [Candidatus Taylorbacteria bacterium]
MRRRILKLRKHRLKEIALWTGVLGFFAVGTLFLWVSTFTLPDLSAFSERKVSQSTKIYDRTGEILLYDLNRGVKRSVVLDNEISRNIKNATVAIEDSDFYEHRGIKLTSIFRAVLANIGAGSFSQGGSTITQQVVKNSLLTTEKKISRKLKEWILAFKLERLLSKTEILDLYLNDAPYGGTVYGIEEASETYFGKKALDLSIAEAAYLASLPNAPSYYSPYGNNKQQLEDRKNLVLSKMLEKKFLSQAEYDSAKKEVVCFPSSTTNQKYVGAAAEKSIPSIKEPVTRCTSTFRSQENLGIKAPHFVMFIRQYLEDTYGQAAIERGGLRVTTTLDYGLQQKAEALAKQFAPDNKKNFNAENLSLVALDPKTGQILAMLGSRDYFDKEIDGNFNVALAHRQPGSSFKPIVYAEAFNKGYTPDTMVFDLATEFDTDCNPDGAPIIKGNEDKCYMPENFDGKYLGPISLRNALAQSRNIPAIKVLYLAGLKDSLRLAKDMGIKSLTNVGQYGLTLVLGGGEVSLMDMTEAYSVLAAGGFRNPYQGILRVEDKTGKVLESFEPRPIKVLPEQTALLINDILSDDAARAPEFGVHGTLYIEGRPVAAKTGTTNDYRDAWILGYTPNLAVGAWAGNNDNSPMVKKIAGFIVAPFWNAFIKETLKQYPVETWKKPAAIEDKTALKPVLNGFWQGGQAYFVNKLSGERATEFTPLELREERVVKQIHSILYWLDKNNPNGPPPSNPADDPQFKLWEYPIRKWVAENHIVEETSAVMPTAEDSMHRPEFAPKVSFINPNPNLVYSKNQNAVIALNITGKFPVAKIDYFINDNFIG